MMLDQFAVSASRNKLSVSQLLAATTLGYKRLHLVLVHLLLRPAKTMVLVKLKADVT
jgi:hypothetical protein